MKIVGIVAEYNPFHKGHAYQIDKIREIFGADTAVVCVMSGDFVQRGEPAVFSKYARAEAAVRCGADLVLELPVQYAVSSARRFAEGAVSVLGKLGVVDTLVFGSESGDTRALVRTAEVHDNPVFDALVKAALESGCSYPVARSAALRELLGEDVTVTPNDNLGVEYIRTILEAGYGMTPMAVKRVGAMHDEIYDGEMKSGSEIRSMVRSGEAFRDVVPEAAYAVYTQEQQAGRGPVFAETLEPMLLARLRMLRLSDFAALPDAAEGLERKLYEACRTGCSLEEIYSKAKSKRYTHARIRRMVLNAALGIRGEDYNINCLYARVLALNSRGGRVLRLAEDAAGLPIISKPGTVRQLDWDVQRGFELTARAHDLYVLGYEQPGQRTGDGDWKTGVVFVAD